MEEYSLRPSERSARPRQYVDIAYPLEGLSETYAFSDQPLNTSRDERNMRSVDPKTGRVRGAQRAGLGIAAGWAACDGYAKIADINYIMREVLPYEWLVTSGVDEVLIEEQAMTYYQDIDTLDGGADSESVIDIRPDIFGQFWALGNGSTVYEFNSDGKILTNLKTFEEPLFANEPQTPMALAVDDFGNIFVCAAQYQVGTDEDVANGNGVVRAYQLMDDGTYRFAWQIEPGFMVYDIAIYGEDLFIAGVAVGTSPTDTVWKFRRYPQYQFDEEPEVEEFSSWDKATSDHSSYTDPSTNPDLYSDQRRRHHLHMAVDENGVVYLTYQYWLPKPAGVEMGSSFLTKLNPLSPVSIEIWSYATDHQTETFDPVSFAGTNQRRKGGYGHDVRVLPYKSEDNETLIVTAGSDFGKTGGSGTFTIDDASLWNGFTSAVDGPSLLITARRWPAAIFNFTFIAVETAAEQVAGNGKWYPHQDSVAGTRDADSAQALHDAMTTHPTFTTYFDVTIAGDTVTWGPKDDGDMAGKWSEGEISITALVGTYNFNVGGTIVDVTGATGEIGLLTPNLRVIADQGIGADFGFGVGSPATDCVMLSASYDPSDGFLAHDEQYMLPHTGRIRMNIDAKGNIFVPYGSVEAESAYSNQALLVLSYDDATSTLSVDRTVSNTEAGINVAVYDRGFESLQFAAAAFQANPNYEISAADYAPLAVIGGRADDDDYALRCLRLQKTTSDVTLGLREIRKLVACNGKFYEWDSTGFTLVNDEDGNPFSYNTATNYVSSVGYKGSLWYSDGHYYYRYDPKDRYMEEWVASSAGTIPRNNKLLAVWRGRMVMARSREDPGTWHMSRIGDPYDWNEFPALADQGAAISARTASAGQCPDSINTIVPYTDDRLLFGCDNSIWQLSGDPASGGQFDLVSDEVGMAFGRPWCKDDTGKLWFFSSRGGLYVLSGEGLQDVSRGKIRKRLQSLDLRNYTVRLVYNYRDDGVHMFVVPYANPRQIVDHYFYDARTGAFHVDRFGRSDGDSIQPTAVCVIDGDAADDRVIVMGCEDGRVRRWGIGENGKVPTSDAYRETTAMPIDSYVLIGPLSQTRDVAAAAVSDMTIVLGDDYSGCHYELYASDDPGDLGDPDDSGELHAGRNGTALVRVHGDSVFLKLRNARMDETWAYEKGTAVVRYAGDVRREA